jgi:hypothetical protein
VAGHDFARQPSRRQTDQQKVDQVHHCTALQ